jgi:hypothetical protein
VKLVHFVHRSVVILPHFQRTVRCGHLVTENSTVEGAADASFKRNHHSPAQVTPLIMSAGVVISKEVSKEEEELLQCPADRNGRHSTRMELSAIMLKYRCSSGAGGAQSRSLWWSARVDLDCPLLGALAEFCAFALLYQPCHGDNKDSTRARTIAYGNVGRASRSSNHAAAKLFLFANAPALRAVLAAAAATTTTTAWADSGGELRLQRRDSEHCNAGEAIKHAHTRARRARPKRETGKRESWIRMRSHARTPHAHRCQRGSPRRLIAGGAACVPCGTARAPCRTADPAAMRSCALRILGHITQLRLNRAAKARAHMRPHAHATTRTYCVALDRGSKESFNKRNSKHTRRTRAHT